LLNVSLMEEIDELKAEIERLKLEIRDLQDSLSVARKIIYDQHHELQRLRRALSHS